jgi:uncharacterized protein YcnI
MRVTKRVIPAALIGVVATFTFAVPAGAHIEPSPSVVKPGSTNTIAFEVGHGCDESPTTKMAFQIPKGATKVTPQGATGWTGEVTGRVVTFTGGPLDSGTPGEIKFTAPKKTGTLYWKVVQTCEVGETRWVSKSEKADHPAPAITVGKAKKKESGHGH